jgi:hypothetical protein
MLSNGIHIGRRGGVRLLGGGVCTPYSQIDGAVSVGTTFEHLADGVVAWTQTTLSPTNPDTHIIFRRQDSNNLWVAVVQDTIINSPLQLFERVAGVYTQRATGGAVSIGHRIAIVANGSTISGYVNNTLIWTYASATRFATETSGVVLGPDGTGGAVSNLKTWSLACRASEGV